jgi:CBS domain-containing protein
MLVREIMTSPALSVPQDASTQMALTLLARAHLTSLPVVNREGHLVGVVSEADVLRPELEPDPRAHLRPSHHTGQRLPRTVAEVMTAHPHTVHEETDVADLARTFSAQSWKSLPVVRDNHLVGVVSRSDVIRALARPDEQIQHDVSRAFARDGQPHWRATVAEGVVEISGVASARERDLSTAIAAAVSGVRRVEHADAPS